MTRLYIFADDSMMGRQVGTEYNLKGTAYIEREVRRLGLQPAGDNGGYFQNLPLYAYTLDSSVDTRRVGGEALTVRARTTCPSRAWSAASPLDGVPVVYGGVSQRQHHVDLARRAAGKIVVLSVPRPRRRLPRHLRHGRAARYGARGRGAAWRRSIACRRIGASTLRASAC